MGPHVVIVGGGFGGIAAAKTLAGNQVRVTVVDRRNYHLFQPLLYQVAIGGLNPSEIAHPIRRILRRMANVRVILSAACGVDLAGKRLLCVDHAIEYDYLILAAGSTTSYYGHPEWERQAPGLKSIEDALEIRRRVLLAFERAELAKDQADQKRWLTLVVIGGGPTGVELAGAIASLARLTLRRDFRSMDPKFARILLIEGGPRILPTFSQGLAGAAEMDLGRLGVEVRSATTVTRIGPGYVCLGDEKIEAETILWAAGVGSGPLGKSLGITTDQSGRVEVEVDLSIPGHPEVFVVGDMAAFHHQGSRPLPGVAPVAMQQGSAAARNLLADLAGRKRTRFHYIDRGNMATIGRAAAIVEFPFGLTLRGFWAWLAWLLVHIALLIGFRNRLVVLVQWAWAYLAFDLGARLITQDHWPVSESEWATRLNHHRDTEESS